MKVDSNGDALASLAHGGAALVVDSSLLAPLAKAALSVEIDFDAVLEGIRARHATLAKDKLPNGVLLTDYFLLLEKLSMLTSDEIVRMSERPLLPGAFRFVLSQASNSKNFEGMLRQFAQGFNLLHGGNYNHVVVRDDRIIYVLDNKDFPYPFELTSEQSHSFMECIMILMHTLFSMCVGTDIDDFLRKVTTKRAMQNDIVRLNQMAYWHVPVSDNNKYYTLVYDFSVAGLPLELSSDDLPAPNAIFGEVAKRIGSKTSITEGHTSFVESVYELLLRKNQTESEIAETLNVSKRTLRRHLEKSRESFSELKSKALNSQAKALLSQNHLVEEVAELLGYSDERSFRRAFLRWNKTTPNSFKFKSDESLESK